MSSAVLPKAFPVVVIASITLLHASLLASIYICCSKGAFRNSSLKASLTSLELRISSITPLIASLYSHAASIDLRKSAYAPLNCSTFFDTSSLKKKSCMEVEYEYSVIEPKKGTVISAYAPNQSFQLRILVELFFIISFTVD